MAHVKTYVLVWIALLVLLGLTISVTLIGFGRLNPVFNLGIAVAKAALVIWFFMHLREGSNLTRLAAGAGFFWLMILFGLGLTDWLAR